MTDIITITRDMAIDLALADEGETVDRYTVASVGEVDDDGLCELVIRDDSGDLWATIYSSHPEIPLFHGEETVEFGRHVARQKVVTEYVKPGSPGEGSSINTRPRPGVPNVRAVATEFVRAAAQRIEHTEIWDALALRFPELPEDAIAEYVQQIAHDALHAIVTVTFPNAGEDA